MPLGVLRLAREEGGPRPHPVREARLARADLVERAVDRSDRPVLAPQALVRLGEPFQRRTE